MSEMCRKCGAKCCQYFCFQIDKPTTYAEFEDVRWYLCHAGVSVHIDEGDWFISILNPCQFVSPEGECTSYADRPLICRKYSIDNCDMTCGDYGYEEHFLSPQELDTYAQKTLGLRTYEAAKARHRARLEPTPLKAKAAKKVLGLRS